MSALRGDIQIAPQEIYSSSATQNSDLGARATSGDGRVYRYVLNGTTAMIAGQVYQSPAQNTTQYQKLGVSTAAGTGTFTVTTGSSVTLAVNQMSGGILSVRSSNGSGFAYGIKGHAAVTSGTVTFNLSDALIAGLTTTSVVDVTANPYSAVSVAPTTLTGAPVGVAVYPVSGSQYGWVQTRGLCAVLSDGAITVGRPAYPSAGTIGALAASGGTQSVIAMAATTTVADAYSPFFLTLE